MQTYNQISSVYTDQIRSFVVLLRFSIYGTCLFLTYVFSSISISASAAWAGSKMLICPQFHYLEKLIRILGLDGIHGL